jgi:hypothetical protein
LEFSQGGTIYRTTSSVFRDPSAWYHIVFVWDSPNATATNRCKIFVNGTEQSYATAPTITQNTVIAIGLASRNQGIGADTPTSGARNFFDGYLEEVNFIDGQALTPSSFGAYNSYGVWSPAKYTGSYGTNGFYLNFQDNSALTTTANVGIGADSSGNGNYWTSNNISITAGVTYDSMVDVPTNTSPTNANFCTLNPLDIGTSATLNNGNLRLNNNFTGTPYPSCRATFGVSSGKWYWEINCTTISGNSPAVGIATAQANINTYLGGDAYSWAYILATGAKGTANNTALTYGAAVASGDVVGVALDMDAGTLTFYKNNVSQGVAFSSLSGTMFPAGFAFNTSVLDHNFGQRPFSYTPPTGFNRLNTYNLPDSIVPVGAQYMAATTYTGTGAARSIANTVNGASFQPDFVWIKDRSVASAHALTNAVTGITKYLESNTTAAETTDTTSVTALNSTGFSLGAGTSIYYTNRNGEAFVGWQWRASNASAVTNTAGTITSSVSANQTAGFSIVTYTGTGANATVGHGLGAAPKMIICKSRTTSNSWVVYHASLGNTQYLVLNTSGAAGTLSTFWNNTSPTSSVFSVGSASNVNQSGDAQLAYCFAAVPGYSAFGSYTGNGSADGPFVYLGFRPRWLMVKKTDTTSDWWIWDTSRNTYNQMQSVLYADLSDAEFTGSVFNFDALSNGFKNRSSNVTVNGSGATYIYAAFAENPFKNSLAR